MPDSVARVVTGFVVPKAVANIVVTDCVFNEVMRKSTESFVIDFEVDGATIVVGVFNEVVGVVTGPVIRLISVFVVEAIVNVLSDFVMGRLSVTVPGR